jgi:hypothetical protein
VAALGGADQLFVLRVSVALRLRIALTFFVKLLNAAPTSLLSAASDLQVAGAGHANRR